jgi:hypothetical protein
MTRVLTFPISVTKMPTLKLNSLMSSTSGLPGMGHAESLSSIRQAAFTCRLLDDARAGLARTPDGKHLRPQTSCDSGVQRVRQ